MKKRFGFTLLLSLIALLIVVALLPTIVSTNLAKDQVVKMINGRLPGELHIDQWSLGWLGGIQCDGIVYQDVPAGISIQVDRVAVSKGLLALALNYRKPGVVEIVRPRGTISLPDTAPSSGEPAGSPPSSEETGTVGSVPSSGTHRPSGEKPGPFVLPLIAAEVHVSDGAVRVVYPDKKEEVVARNIMFKLNSRDPEKPVIYQLSAHAGEGNGEITGQGSVLIPPGGGAGSNPTQSNQIQSNADITIKEWNLAPLLAVGAAVSDIPSGRGTINGRLHLQGDPAAGLHLTGQVIGTDIRLAGGRLKTDRPSVKKITCRVDALQNGKAWTINQLDIDSIPVRGTVKGRQDKTGSRRFQVKGALNLAEISAQLPATLNLKPGTRITRGEVAVAATVESDAQTTHFDGKIHLDQLVGRSGGKKLALDKPISATAAGAYGVDGIHLDTFSIQSAFLSGTGQGDLDDLRVNLKADLRAALKEAGKFIDTKGWRAAGKIKLAVHAGSRSEATHFIAADLDSDAFQLIRKNRVVIPRHRLRTHLTADVQLDKKSRLQAILKPSVDFDAWAGKGGVNADRLVFNSNGTLSAIKKLAIRGTYHLKPLSTLAGVFGGLPADTTLHGTADVSLAGDFDGQTITLEKVAVNMTDFSCQARKKRLNYRKLQLTAQGKLRPSDRSVDFKRVDLRAGREHIRLSPLKIPDWSKMADSLTLQMEGNADLSRFHALLRDTLDAQVIPSGRVVFKLGVKKATGSAGNMTCQIDSDNFLLGNKGASKKPQALSIGYKGRFSTRSDGQLGALTDTKVDYRAWLGKGHVSVKQIEWPKKGHQSPRVDQVAYDGTLALKPFSRLLRALNLFPAGSRMAGQADIHTRLSAGPGQIVFDDTAVTIGQFVFEQGKQRFTDKKIKLHTKGNVNLITRSARLTPLEITAAAGKVAFPELVIRDWNDLAHGVKGNGTTRLNLTALMPLLGKTIGLPDKTTITGQADVEIKSDLTDTKNQALSLLCSLAPIRIESEKKTLLDEDKVKMTVELKGDLTRSNMVIQKLAIAGRPLSMTATGRISPQGKEKVLSATGDLTVDLEKLQNPINALLGTDLEISGKSERPFSIHFTTKNGEWGELFKRAALSAALHADRINGFGLALTSVDIPVTVKKSRARSDIRARANEGELVLQPGIDLASASPVLSLPDNSKVLNNTRITREMANKLLALIHPIFRGTAAVQGAVDLTMHHFSWPLPEKDRKDARFSGILKFKDVRLKAEGLVYDLLAVMKVKERDTTIGNRTIKFSCKNGRIECSPLRMKVKDYRLEVSGTMGFDGTLDYIARIPVTSELVGKKAFAYLKDAAIDIPIGGTVSRPELNMESFQQTLKKLAGKAAGNLLEQNAGKLLRKLFK
ncbi:MAG: hypothetical protein DSY90_02695 [Deltaproteobacteria bacterium]|nr:MAG: hypothetical protein DSY90_02695 [Deltaproteobacteria bacterium]